MQNIKWRNQRMLTLTKSQHEVLSELGLHIDKEYSLQDIIEILPESIKGKDGRVGYELVVRKYEVCYESYDVVYDNGAPFMLASFIIDDKKYKSILDCAFEMLKWCLKEKYIKNG